MPVAGIFGWFQRRGRRGRAEHWVERQTANGKAFNAENAEGAEKDENRVKADPFDSALPRSGQAAYRSEVHPEAAEKVACRLFPPFFLSPFFLSPFSPPFSLKKQKVPFFPFLSPLPIRSYASLDFC